MRMRAGARGLVDAISFGARLAERDGAANPVPVDLCRAGSIYPLPLHHLRRARHDVDRARPDAGVCGDGVGWGRSNCIITLNTRS